MMNHSTAGNESNDDIDNIVLWKSGKQAESREN